MPATTEMRVSHGAAPGLGTDATGLTLRMKQADDAAQDTQDEIPIPAVGVAFGWRKNVKLAATTAPDNRISNLRIFSLQESLGIGREIFFGRSSSYVQASAADEAGAIGSTNMDVFTATSPEVIQAGDVFLSTDAYPSDGGARQDYWMFQARHDVTAISGDAAASKTLVARWDESRERS